MGEPPLASLMSSADDFLLQCPDSSSHKKKYYLYDLAPVTMGTGERGVY